MIRRVLIALVLMAAVYTDAERALSVKLQRPVEEVHRDLRLIAHYRANIHDFFDDFFVQPGWLYGPLADFERRCVTLMHTGGPRVFIVQARGHNKTTRSRIYQCAMIALGLEPYIVTVAASSENNKSNQDAVLEVFTAEKFAKVQRLASYFHGLTPPESRDGLIEFAGGKYRSEFRPILGNMLGMNHPKAGGRPSLILPDDIMPPTAYFSRAVRRQIDMRMTGVIEPIGRKGFRIVGNGTPMDAEDFVGRKVRGNLGGYVLNDPKDRAAIDPTTGKVLWEARWTREALEAEQAKMVRDGMGAMYDRYYLCSVDTTENKPLASKPIHRYQPDEGAAAFPYHLYRLLAIDFSLRVGKDNTAIGELGMTPDEDVLLLNGAMSNTWDDDRLYAEVIGMIRARPPHGVLIAENTDSITFIRELTKKLKDAGLSVTLITPKASSFGNKNAHIIGQLQYRLKHGKIKAPQGAIWGQWFDSQAGNFEYDNEDNDDDFIDMVATGCAYLKKPEPMPKAKSKLDLYVERMERMRDDEEYT